MTIYFEIFDGTNWIDKTSKLARLSWSISGRELEKLTVELMDETLSVGQNIRMKRGANIVFEGIIYNVNQSHEGGRVKRVEADAYSQLILYDRYVVFRSYATGTTAGAIIRDIASLESGVDVTNVDDGPSLTGPWSIENLPALRVMQDVAKGTNYYIRMKPGKYLYYKPKTITTYKTILDSTKVISAEYSEDRWKLKNRVIYVGANGEVLADVSEGAGDLPVVVSDPFLTDATEAQRRAQIRLALNKEYGKQLRLTIHQSVFESANLDLFDTVRVNLPSLGLNNVDMFLIEIEYEPSRQMYNLVLGGKLELFEEFLSEAMGGDVAARFGQKVSVAEAVGNAISLTQSLSRRFITQLIPTLFMTAYLPPIPYASGQNITYNDAGEIVLASGFTSGNFTLEFMPQSENVEVRRLQFDYSAGGGSLVVNLKRADGTTIKSNVVSPYDFPYIPKRKTLAEKDADKWSITGGTLSDSTISIISRYSLKAMGTSSMTLQYPATGALAWNLSEMRYFNIYVYPISDATIEVRALTNTTNYFKAPVTVKGGQYQKYVKQLADFSAVGSPSWSNINTLQIILPAGTFYIDFDYVFTPITYEKIVIEVSMSRPDVSAVSPAFKKAFLFWSEVTQA